jgi:hypothetical protein
MMMDMGKEHDDSSSPPPGRVVRFAPKVERDRVKGELEGIVSRKIDDELMQLIGMPAFLYKGRAQYYLAFSSDAKLESAHAAARLFAPVLARDDPKVESDAYGILITETMSQGYILLLDAGRRIAVKARIYSYQDEEARGWSELKISLAATVRMAGNKAKNKIVVWDEDLIRIFDIEKNQFV